MFERITSWYLSGWWSVAKVEASAARGWITLEQSEFICSQTIYS